MAKKHPSVLLGPVQFVVIGLQNEQLKGQVASELHRASKKGDIRVLDALAIQKTNDGNIRTLSASDLTPDQRRDYGSLIGALMGLGATGTIEGAEIGALVGAETFADRTFGLSARDIQSIARDIPPGMTGLLVLFEHRWALRLKGALLSAGGVVVAQGMVQPEALIEFGAALADAETAADQYEQALDTQMH